MNYVWKKVDGTKIENLGKYIKDYIIKFPSEYELFIGTDSQRIRKRFTVLYAMVICIYRKGKGAHIIYSKHKRNDIKDKFTRLRTEVAYSIEIANYLTVNDVLTDSSIMTIHIDLSPNIKYASNTVYKEAIGWITGMGYLWKAKPNAPAASYCSDYVVKNVVFEVENSPIPQLCS